MKHTHFFLLLTILITPMGDAASQSVELTILSTWQELDANPDSIKQFGGKWILAGIIDVKKRSPQTIRLDKLILHWQGNHIPNLLGSLYKKDVDKKFIPLEENLICDSHWDGTSQNLILKFDTLLNLEAHTTLFLVLTIPADVEHTLLQGSFRLESTALPLLLQQSLSKPLTLVCGRHTHTQNI